MKLFYSSGACSMAPHIVLRESGLKFTTEAVDLSTGKYQGGSYSQINPKGSVPAFQLDNGEILTEGAVIMQYIADQVPEKKLVPKNGTLDRYRCQEWLNYIATEIHKGFAPLWNDESTEAVQAGAKENLAQKFEFLSEHLKNKNYLMGDQFTVADAYLFTVLNWTGYLKVDLSRWPKLIEYMSQIKARSTVVETMKSEGLIK